MQFFKNLKNLASFVLVVFTITLITACVDKIPSAVKKGTAAAEGTYYKFRSDRYKELEASYLSAQQFCCGKDKPNDDVKSLNLYCNAAEFGHKASMVEIGRMYSHQYGAVNGYASAIPHDNALAYVYFSEASKDGYDYAGAMKQDISKKLSEQDMERVKSLEGQFPNIPCKITR